ncbi:NAD(P)-binding domain-containing protein [Epidermidibacterium keratini]|uniref:Ketol-acid reductoisomerase type 1 n=1 Tax=Epidermidibacterium keratini TaxID=1891644 RepID=A0A7L4YQQ9_9ACTN|nr:NAD(P)-binding domain-containing protein [Epidermidibacterium keratini]QHC01486.1 NAD(P)-binding domain-containing protein [Epidermidibacterium keratini]
MVEQTVAAKAIVETIPAGSSVDGPLPRFEDGPMDNETPMYFDDDASLSHLDGKTVAVIGYGNQGHAQAQNLRDSGIEVIVGNRDDEYADASREAGFETLPIADAAKQADVVLLLIPDEVQPDVVREQIAPGLAADDVLVVASGYNWHFGEFAVPEGVDVVMVAPRMIGAAVRSRFESRVGYPCFVSAERDASGSAFDVALAVARGIGATAGGAIASSAREEAALDLFTEQAIWPAIFNVLRASYDVLTEAGFSDEAILYEMYLSGEPAEVFDRVARDGVFEQMKLHSRTSQFGQLGGIPRFAEISGEATELMRSVLNDDILSGEFAKKWSRANSGDADVLPDMLDEAGSGDLPKAEQRVRSRARDML